jgi:hypothetical protein
MTMTPGSPVSPLGPAIVPPEISNPVPDETETPDVQEPQSKPDIGETDDDEQAGA